MKRIPIVINLKTLWCILVFLVTLCANIGAGAWVASAYKADYDNRLRSVERNVSDLSDAPIRLSNIEGKLDVVLRLLGAQ